MLAVVWIRVLWGNNHCYTDFHVFFNHQAQLFAKREHEGVVQMLEVSVYYTTVTSQQRRKWLLSPVMLLLPNNNAPNCFQEFRMIYQNRNERCKCLLQSPKRVKLHSLSRSIRERRSVLQTSSVLLSCTSEFPVWRDKIEFTIEGVSYLHVNAKQKKYKYFIISMFLVDKRHPIATEAAWTYSTMGSLFLSNTWQRSCCRKYLYTYFCSTS